MTAARGCREAGSIAVNPMPVNATLADGYERADIDGEVDSPETGAGGQTLEPGPKTGNWHMVLVCDHHTVDGVDAGSFALGWVGVMVKPPAWDTSGIERQFFLTALSVSDEVLLQRIADASKGHVGKASGAVIEWLPPIAKQEFHFAFADESHGRYQAWAAVRSVGNPGIPPTRFWINAPAVGATAHSQVDGHADGYRPFSFDFETSPDAAFEKFVERDTTDFFAHQNPDGTPVQGHQGPNGGAIVWDGFSRAFTWGQAPSHVVLRDTYVH